ncbi:MAG: type II toxin-antitoxin system VapC family toxin [Anaerolineae bacterium]
MILYLDSSALVKRYVAEIGSQEVVQAIAQADIVGTVVITRAEVAAAFAKAVRVAALTQDAAQTCLERFRRDWPHLVRTRVTEATVARADQLAWRYQLRGYDAVHLAAAVLWQDALGEMVTMAAFDLKLWQAAGQAGLLTYPTDLSNQFKQR